MMAAEAGRETRQGAESDEESDGCDGAQDCERVRVSVRNTTHTKPQGFIIRIPLLTTNKVFHQLTYAYYKASDNNNNSG
jgi:hypothetical protein